MEKQYTTKKYNQIKYNNKNNTDKQQDVVNIIIQIGETKCNAEWSRHWDTMIEVQ